MADPDNRPFHVVTGVLAIAAGLLGHSVTLPHPQAWLFGAAAAFAVLVPAEVAFLVLNSASPAKRRPVRAPEASTGYDHYSLLGRALTAIEKVRPGETELSKLIRQAVAILEERIGDNTLAVVELRVTVKQTTETLERYARDPNPDPIMVDRHLQFRREQVEDAIAAVEPG